VISGFDISQAAVTARTSGDKLVDCSMVSLSDGANSFFLYFHGVT